MIRSKIPPKSFWVSLGILFLFTLLQFYRETIGIVASDVIIHMQAGAENSGYSLLHNIFFLLSKSSWYVFWVSLLLALCVIATVMLTRQLILENISPESLDMRIVNFFALTLCLVSMIVLPGINQYWYLGQGSPNPWHNPTYLLCRVFGVLTVLYFIRIYKNGLFSSPSNLLCFAISLMLATYAKPSFPSIFMPAAMTILMADLIFYKKRETIRMILGMGVLFLPSVGIVLFQSLLVFGGDTGGKLIFILGSSWSIYSNSILLSVLSAFAFPLYVFMTKRQSNILYTLCMGCFFYGVLAYTFMGEEGPRATHLNMGWGAWLGLFFAFIASAVVLIEKRQEKKWATWATVLYGLHLISGVAYVLKYVFTGNYS